MNRSFSFYPKSRVSSLDASFTAVSLTVSINRSHCAAISLHHNPLKPGYRSHAYLAWDACTFSSPIPQSLKYHSNSDKYKLPLRPSGIPPSGNQHVTTATSQPHTIMPSGFRDHDATSNGWQRLPLSATIPISASSPATPPIPATWRPAPHHIPSPHPPATSMTRHPTPSPLLTTRPVHLQLIPTTIVDRARLGWILKSPHW